MFLSPIYHTQSHVVYHMLITLEEYLNKTAMSNAFNNKLK